MTILGGIGTIWGSVIGALVFLLLRDWLSTWTDAWGVVTGAIFVVIVLGFRRGIWGTLLQVLYGRRVAMGKLEPAVHRTEPAEEAGTAPAVPREERLETKA